MREPQPKTLPPANDRRQVPRTSINFKNRISMLYNLFMSIAKTKIGYRLLISLPVSVALRNCKSYNNATYDIACPPDEG